MSGVVVLFMTAKDEKEFDHFLCYSPKKHNSRIGAGSLSILPVAGCTLSIWACARLTNGFGGIISG